MGTERKSFEYGVGALVVLVISLGVAAVAYAGNILKFDVYNVLAWVFGPLGVYTLIYSAIAGKELTYYLVWGTVMFAVGIVSAFYNVVNPFIILGILLIVIAVIGLVAYMRSKK